MVQDVQVHQLDEFASRDCGKVRVEVMIRDSMGPAASEDATDRCINIITINLIGAKSLALRLHRPPGLADRPSTGELLFNDIKWRDLHSVHGPMAGEGRSHSERCGGLAVILGGNVDDVSEPPPAVGDAA